MQFPSRKFRRTAVAGLLVLSLSSISEWGYTQDLTDNTNLSNYHDDNSGLLIHNNVNFDGEGGNLTIGGVLNSSNPDAIDCDGNGPAFYFGLQNEGSLTNVNTITTDTIINVGKMEAGEVTITKQGADAYFMNNGFEGTNPEVTLNGSINIDSRGWVNNTQGAVMNLNGKDAVVGTELANDYGATLNINGNTRIVGALWNVGETSTINIADGVVVTTHGGFANGMGRNQGGTVNASGASLVITEPFNIFSNTGTTTFGSVSVAKTYMWGVSNSGNLTVNNEIDASIGNFDGTITYNGTKPVNGDIQNSGTIYATQGTLGVNGRLTMTARDAAIWKNKSKEQANIEVSEDLEMFPATKLEANELTAQRISNQGAIKAKKITVKDGFRSEYVERGKSSIETDELVIGTTKLENGKNSKSVIGASPSGATYYGNSRVIVHKKLVFDSTNGTPVLENRDGLIFPGDNVVIEGDGKLVNQEIYTYWSGTSVGLIAKAEDKTPIENLTVKAELVNQGELHAKNLAVSKGVDGIEQEDGTFKDSHAFNVENFTVLDNGNYSLQSSKRTFNNVNVGTNASLAVSKNLEVKDSVRGTGTLHLNEGANASAANAVQLQKVAGSGTLRAGEETKIKDIDDFSGVLRLEGNAGLGTDTVVKTSDVPVTLTLPAGFKVQKATIYVGKQKARELSQTALNLLQDSALAIVADDSYDGTSPLLTAPTAAVAEGVPVYVFNAEKVKDGTTVIHTTDGEDPSGYEVIAGTDHVLKVIRNNKIQTLEASQALGIDVLAGSLFSAAVDAGGEASKRVVAITGQPDKNKAAKALNAIALMGTASGAQTAAVNTTNNVIDTINRHGSSLMSYSHDKHGADLWVDLNGTFSKADRYSAGNLDYGYKSDISGVTVGGDFGIAQDVTLGAAFSFGKGSVRGQGSGAGIKNDVEYYGLNLYSVWNTGLFNVIGTLGYLNGKNKITSQGFQGKPHAKTYSAGIRVEKPIAVNEFINATPHIGFRYKYVDLDSFRAGGFSYYSEKARIAELPIGVAFSANLASASGAKIKPFIDLTVTPNFGDRKVRNSIAIEGAALSDSFDARIANNAMFKADLGLSATMKAHSLSFSYTVGDGNHGRLDQVLQAKYRVEF